MPVLVAAVAALGLAVGSFLNVVIHRLPAGTSLMRPGSHCPACGSPVRIRHNIPVVGWLVLRGRCADCAAAISPRYPIFELVTGALFALTAVRLQRLDLLAALPAYLFFVAIGIALAAIDLDVLRLPNAIVYPSYLVLAMLLGGASLVEGHAEALVRALIGGVALFLLFLAIALASGGAMGLGDVKLAGLIGAVLGFLSFPAVVVGVFSAFVLGAMAGAVLLLARRAGRKTAVPFGPALIGGALVAVYAGWPLFDAYLSLTHAA